MEANYKVYNFDNCLNRIDNIINNSDTDYSEKDSIPPRSSLTYSNGFNVQCSVLFVDLRKSKDLNDSHTKPVLAKIFKTYISETIAIMNSHSQINEIYIEGDGVWGIFDTTQKVDIDELFSIACRVNSLIDVLNIKYKKKGYSEITAGIGMHFGKSLLIKAGYNGSGINEVVWIGKVVGEAAKLSNYGSKSSSDNPIMMSGLIQTNLNDENKKLVSYNSTRECYHSSAINIQMNNWVTENG